MSACPTIKQQCCCQPDDGQPCEFQTVEQVAAWGNEWRDAALAAQAKVQALEAAIALIVKNNHERDSYLRSYTLTRSQT